MNTVLQFHRQTRTGIRLVLILATFALGVLLAGCLSRPALVRQTFAFETPPPKVRATADGGVLALQSVQISAPFARQSFVYRTGPEAYEVDPYAGFLAPPERAIAAPIRGWLRNSGAFQSVTEPGSPMSADKLLYVYVAELYGDFRKKTTPAAVLSLHILLLDAGKGGPGDVLLQISYDRRVPLSQHTATAVMAGWNQALSEILTNMTTDLTKEMQ